MERFLGSGAVGLLGMVDLGICHHIDEVWGGPLGSVDAVTDK